MFFDAFGRFAFGQISKPTTSTAVLAAAPGSFAVTAPAIMLTTSQPSGGGTSAFAGISAAFQAGQAAAVVTYSLNGVAVSFGSSEAVAAGSCTLTGVAIAENVTLPSGAGTSAFTGRPVPLAPTIVAVSGSYSLTGFAANEPFTEIASAGSFIITGSAPLLRTGADFDLVYGGIGHYLEEIERLKQLAKITRKTPAAIVQQSGPLRPMPSAPVVPAAPAIDLQALAAQRFAQQQAQAEQARIVKRRAQDIEILLLAS
jgi:hypothetical protein